MIMQAPTAQVNKGAAAAKSPLKSTADYMMRQTMTKASNKIRKELKSKD